MDNNSMIPKNSDIPTINIDALCRNSIELIRHARKIAANQVNFVQLMTYYVLGYWIVEEQQSGRERAGYGKKVIQTLSDALNAEFGKGFSVDTLENTRKFYLSYQNRISETVLRKFVEQKSDTLFRISDESLPFTLSWSHYLQLMRIKNPEERRFYEIEATKSAWSLRTLQRQYNSSLCERLALSRNCRMVSISPRRLDTTIQSGLGDCLLRGQSKAHLFRGRNKGFHEFYAVKDD